MNSPNPTPSAASSPPSQRIQAIDALRGLVMLLMLVDHTREFFFIHAQVSDPMDVAATSPALFFSRLAAHLCAPIFVALTGVSAWLYGAKAGGAAKASAFLFKRGLFLVALEVTVISFAWTFSLTPSFVSLQVIWAIGLSMIALSAIVWAPRTAIILLGLTIVLGHNLLDGLQFSQSHWAHVPWAVLHDRGFLDLPWGGQARTSYPVLPWIGVAALGYAIGPWFAGSAQDRALKLAGFASISLVIFILLRATNFYGDPTPWSLGADDLHSVMSFLNLTKYPPSADFLLLTLGLGALVIPALERAPSGPVRWLAVYGSAPLFFYILHLYGLHLLYQVALGVFGPVQGEVFGLPNIGWIWLLAAVIALPSWYACRWFAGVKRASRLPLLKYL